MEVQQLFDVCFLYLMPFIFINARPGNLYKAEDFSKFTASGDVLLDVCTADSPVQLMMDRGSKRVSVHFIKR